MNKLFQMMNKIFHPITLSIAAGLIIGSVIGYGIWTYEAPISFGVVYNKSFHPYKEWTETVENCTDVNFGSGVSVPICSSSEVQRSSPDMWFVDIEGETDKGNKQQRKIRVDEKLFDSTNVSDTFFVPGEADN